VTAATPMILIEGYYLEALKVGLAMTAFITTAGLAAESLEPASFAKKAFVINVALM
jgi:hypothetical protein